MRTSTPALLIAILLLAGCGGGGKKTSSGAAPSVTQTPATTPAPTPTPPPLPAQWYADTDDNGIPNFIEREIGRDPKVDDCTQGTCRIPGGTTTAQAERGRSTIIALDASGSMGATAGGGDTKMAAAKQAIRGYVRNTPPALDRFGFVVFGHKGDNSDAGKAVSCRGVETLAPAGALDRREVGSVLARFRPTGWTPIAAALQQAGRQFKRGQKEVARILLVTDGLETCGGDPQAAALALQRRGIHVSVDVVGLDVSSGQATDLRRLAESTGGTYYDAGTTDALRSRFQQFQADQARLARQLICLSQSANSATICRGTMESTATINMGQKRDALRADGDTAGADEVQRIITDMRARATNEVADIRTKLDSRSEKVREQLAKLAREGP